LSADCVVPIYEADLLKLNLASKGDVVEESDEDFVVRDAGNGH